MAGNAALAFKKFTGNTHAKVCAETFCIGPHMTGVVATFVDDLQLSGLQISA
jgi:hypothetical protein